MQSLPPTPPDAPLSDDHLAAAISRIYLRQVWTGVECAPVPAFVWHGGVETPRAAPDPGMSVCCRNLIKCETPPANSSIALDRWTHGRVDGHASRCPGLFGGRACRWACATLPWIYGQTGSHRAA
eukprot:352909-Chlamydomonas_euryale.AAC.4